jgi:hypothetical protein
MGKAYFAQKLREASGFPVFKRGQNAFLKEAHHRLKQATTNLQPFLTIYLTPLRACNL